MAKERLDARTRRTRAAPQQLQRRICNGALLMHTSHPGVMNATRELQTGLSTDVLAALVRARAETGCVQEQRRYSEGFDCSRWGMFGS